MGKRVITPASVTENVVESNMVEETDRAAEKAATEKAATEKAATMSRNPKVEGNASPTMRKDACKKQDMAAENAKVESQKVESEAHAIFAKIDLNGDRSISNEELKAYVQQNVQESNRWSGGRFIDAFNTALAHVSKEDFEAISEEEFIKLYEAMIVFGEADANNNGVLSKKELRQYVRSHQGRLNKLLGQQV